MKICCNFVSKYISKAMNTIQVPFSAELQNMTIEQINALIDDLGVSLSVDQVNWKKQYPYKPLTRATLVRTEQMFYIKWHVNGIMLKARYTDDMQPVNEDSCVEFFCLLPDGRHYINFEFNCIGTCSAKRRLSRTEDVVPLSKSELESIVRYSSLGRRPFCEIDGQFTWDLLVGIPLSLFMQKNEQGAYSGIVRANFYKCADDTSAKHYLSWVPIRTESPDFHCTRYFGEVRF